MIIPVHLNQDITASAMIDSGASTQFIDLDFAIKNNLPLTLKPKPETLIVVDGREAENQLTHTCTLDLTVDQHLETLTFQVTKLARRNMILGKTWLKRHCKWGSGLLKSRLCFLTSKNHKQDYKQRGTTTLGVRRNNNSYQCSYYIVAY